MKLLGLALFAFGLVYADDALQELQKGNIEFSASLYQQLIKTTPGNIIVSPLSVQLVLALAQLGTKGETALELSRGLRLPDSPEKIKEGFKALLPKLKGNEFYSLDSANKIYLKDGYAINPDYLNLAKEIFDAALENIDFADNVKASQSINKWVESKTNEKIRELISPSALNDLTRLVLVNAVYFKGKWSSPFEVYETNKQKFFNAERDEIEVDTMHQIKYFNYFEDKDLDAKFLELPYKGDDVSFTIVLPNKKDSLSALEGRVNEVFRPQNYSYERISLYMPRFKIESSFPLIPALEALGIKKPFTDGDLTGMLANPEPLVISDVIQKAFINVTESGTEAAAATAVVIELAFAAPPPQQPPLEIRVDHPFLYSIAVKDAGIVFLGRVNDPLV